MMLNDINWKNWIPEQQATLLFIIRDGQVLLIDKKRGLGAGKINGPGGRMHSGETPREAAIREVQEEVGVTPLRVKKVGEVLFHVLDDESIRIHIFRAENCYGDPKETEEAIPRWTPVDHIPYDDMWEDDRHWFPLMLAGKPFEMRTIFRGEKLLDHEVILAPPFSDH